MAGAGTVTCHRDMQMEEMAETMVSPGGEDSKIRMLFIYSMNKRPIGNCWRCQMQQRVREDSSFKAQRTDRFVLTA